MGARPRYEGGGPGWEPGTGPGYGGARARGAHDDAVPNLEIETGDIIGAGHAATVGRFDDEQEFYLRARGIPPEEARRLIVRGFFSEVIGRIPVAAIREDLENRVAAELEALQQHA